MTKKDVIPAWAGILRGRRPLLSIEITRECPLRCPGCYAFDAEHLAGIGSLRNLSDLKGKALVDGVLDLIRSLRPVHVSIIGGEPLVRYRELNVLLPLLNQMKLEVQLVTSAVRPIPIEWRELQNLHLSVSIDGLQPEHDKRRAPATYERILKHVTGHQILVHCTITRQQLNRPDYIRTFSAFWSERREVRKIWFSLYTPQEGERSEERLTAKDRAQAISTLTQLREIFPKINFTNEMREGFLNPPQSPEECVFAQVTNCVSADLETRITPCQLGGRPVCKECGCLASAGLAGVGRHKIGGLVPISNLLAVSQAIGKTLNPTAA
ncbi:MAG TPA: radical SAM protein [Terriglobia bacterium]|nr:radical SAM protein [Terriglobia bacterium]